jgi:hypothetical protein
VPHNKPDDFWMSTAEQLIDQFHDVTAVVALVMVVLSSIGLLVGGIGVMNIMLVSVTERTREIGIRKAVGARRTDIVIQFLTEAVVLTGMGGLLGLLLGWLISSGVKFVFPNLPTAVPLWAAIAGVTVSAGVGLFFGIWPANKAARRWSRCGTSRGGGATRARRPSSLTSKVSSRSKRCGGLTGACASPKRVAKARIERLTRPVGPGRQLHAAKSALP